MPDLYSVLGLTYRAKSEDIKAAYWALAKRSHPDVNADDEEAEPRIKEINRAYETLGDPEARAAYDREQGRLRARARRSFWGAAAAGAATSVLLASVLAAAVMWSENADLQPSKSGELRSSTRSNESLLEESSAENGARPSVKPTGLERGGIPGKAANTALPPGPRSAKADLAEAATRDQAAQAPGAPAEEVAPSQGLSQEERPKPSAGASGPATAQWPEGPAAAPPVLDAPPRSARGSASSQNVGARRQLPTATVDQTGSEKLASGSEDQPAAVFRMGKQPKKNASKPRRSEREPGLRSAKSMRFPSADEPYVNVGGRTR
jgi:curved DNA-binding protein CbpA